MSAPSKQYDIVVLGATGYTGKLTAEYIGANLPTNLSWALAGRSQARLGDVATTLKSKSPDRTPPGIEVVQLTTDDLIPLAQKTRVLINVVGPYHLYSTPVVAACAQAGTHYLDVTGEAPWVLSIIEKYHAEAQRTGAIMIPCIGLECSPADLLALSLVDTVRETLGPQAATRSIIAALTQFKVVASGGTLSTILTMSDSFSPLQMAAAHSGQFLSSPVSRPASSRTLPPLLTRIFGVRRHVPHLGTLTSAPTAGVDVATVQRSWGLLNRGQYYGPRFEYTEYQKVSNTLLGVVIHLGLALGMALLSIAPLRWLAKKFVFQPGQGASEADGARDVYELKAVATVDAAAAATQPPQALGRFRYDGSVYYLTGLFLAEGAMTLLAKGKEDEMRARFDGGGILTPATLGKDFIERVTRAGVVLESGMISR